MKMVNVTSNYAVELTVPQFQKLDGIDFLGVVQPKLQAAGAERIEYNGHFGPNVFFTARPGNAQRVLDTLRRLVNAKNARAQSDHRN